MKRDETEAETEEKRTALFGWAEVPSHLGRPSCSSKDETGKTHPCSHKDKPHQYKLEDRTQLERNETDNKKEDRKNVGSLIGIFEKQRLEIQDQIRPRRRLKLESSMTEDKST